MIRTRVILWTTILAAAACGNTGASAKSDGGSDAAAPTCTLAAPVLHDWRLTAHGTLLEDELGRTVFLRGLNGGERSKFAPYVPFDFKAADYASALDSYTSRAESWGIDVMRLTFAWAALEPSPGMIDEEWLGRYAALVASAWSHGIWAVVDFHQDVYSEVYCGDGFPAWTVKNPPAPHHDCPGWSFEYANDPAVQAAFDAFWADANGLQERYLAAWDKMIARLADTPGVLGFEIINEPSAGSADEATFESQTLSAFYTKVATHMRARAPRSLVFVDPTATNGVTVSTEVQNPRVSGVVFAPHFYPLVPGDASAMRQGLQPWADIGRSWDVPVFLGEFGTSNTNTTTPDYMASTWSAVDALGFAGATEWEYSVTDQLWNSESFSMVRANGDEYPVARSMTRPYARAVAGSSVSQSWDPSKKVFSLSYVPAAGATDISEVRLPAAAFSSPPGGHAPSVKVEGACYDLTTVKGELLLRASPSANKVTLTVGP